MVIMKLPKTKISRTSFRQCSSRGGNLEIFMEENTIRIRGTAVVVFKGKINI